MKYGLGIIGTGVMANAIIDCAIQRGAIKPQNIIAFDTDSLKLDEINKKGIAKAKNIQELAGSSQIVMLAVKPQHYTDILDNNNFDNVNALISIMAGVKIATLRKKLNNSTGIARVMPNTPCKIAKGFCGICFDSVNDKDKQFITAMFTACGDVAFISEDKFDALTSISGSGPAYIYMFLNGMIKGGVEGNLSYDEAKKMAISTMIGAANLAKLSDNSMEELVQMVCSKGGTTIEAVEVFRKYELEEIIAKGITACRNKSKLLSEKL